MKPLPHTRWQRGTYVVEFAIVFPVLLTILFGIVEIARIMYIYNTLQDATRRAAFGATVSDYRQQDALQLVKQQAIFRATPGELVLGSPITDEHIRIDYLALIRNSESSLAMTPIATGNMPASPARNRVTCTADPNDGSCIRFVRVRVCDPADTASCRPVYYAPLFGLFPRTLRLPTSTTIVTAATLGYTSGQTP
jgi:hypothetical protein